MPTWSGDRLRRFAKHTCVFAILRIDWDRVSKTRVALYREEDGSCPFIEWFDKLPAKVQDKCHLRLERLREMGHQLRRPEADFLRDGIYELRASLGGVHHRILYFFHGAVAAVVSHGLAKERVVPPKEIDRAVERKKRFKANPAKHTYEEA
jgi:phage-related protein